MPIDRIAAFLRPILSWRVEACFLAALVFTLAHQADDHRPRIEVRTATTHHAVVHEVAADRKLVIRSHSATSSPCAAMEQAGAGATGGTCRIVRVHPATAAPRIATVRVDRR